MKIIFSSLRFINSELQEVYELLNKYKLDWQMFDIGVPTIPPVITIHHSSLKRGDFDEKSCKKISFLRTVFQREIKQMEKFDTTAAIFRFILALITNIGEEVDREKIGVLFEICMRQPFNVLNFDSAYYVLVKKGYIANKVLIRFDENFINSENLKLPDYRLKILMPNEIILPNKPPSSLFDDTSKDIPIEEEQPTMNILDQLTNLQKSIDELKADVTKTNSVIKTIAADVVEIKQRTTFNEAIANTVNGIHTKMDDLLIERVANHEIREALRLQSSMLEKSTAPKAPTNLEIEDSFLNELNDKLDKLLALEIPSLDKIQAIWTKNDMRVSAFEKITSIITNSITPEKADQAKKMLELIFKKE